MRTETTILRAGCKINLYLEITGVRADGYHELRTLFHPLDEPHDTLRVTPGKTKGLAFSCDQPDLSGDDNLVVRAYAAFARATGYAPDLAVHLEKRIPSGAGLGGGSSDAASLLRHLNEMAGQQALAPGELNTLAAGLGADVPFFLQDSWAWATGIGEELAPPPDGRQILDDFHVLLLCPPVKVATALAYRAWDEAFGEKTPPSPPLPGLTAFSGTDNSLFFFNAVPLYNSFEDVVFKSFPELRSLKETALSLGAAGALMSGSGSSVFALFRDSDRAQAAARALAPKAATYLRSALNKC